MTGKKYDRLVSIISNYETAQIIGGINWIFVESTDYRDLIGVYNDYFGKPPKDSTIWVNHQGIYTFRLHR